MIGSKLNARDLAQIVIPIKSKIKYKYYLSLNLPTFHDHYVILLIYSEPTIKFYLRLVIPLTIINL